ncbi:hypothetical protein [Ralstonia mannitolilytica]|uniref:Uncharacterized protein n=1 Tax=Ralstonia mannitolilytica TaxID=105219 RepID=A0AAJ4ZID4_9RALS|nr:hypothetical protein [Ralstonia mannitolilytica]CAG2153197.1 hypothetical protein LMG6866_04392 [Ralstonia mannitolilytica]SUD89573.1 Uncharacterised protein [Ralstonia mannitolilytica]SUD95953.1 Uncharacterised protein [Ralstonia mannitolilytica]
MTDRILPEVVAEVGGQPTPGVSVVEQRAEAISRAAFGALAATALAETSAQPLPGARLPTLWVEALAEHAPPLHAPALWVEVLRRDTAAAAMVTEAMEAFGETPWPEAQRGVFAFRHDWAEPLIERLEWKTGVARLASGNEARQGLRRVPRRFLTYHVGHARASDALVADWLADHLGRLAWWPLPQHAVRLTSAADRGARLLPVTPVDAAGFAPAAAKLRLEEDGLHWPADRRFALLMAADCWQVLQLADVEPERLWLTEPLARAVPAGATVLPLVEGLAVEPAEFAQWVPGLDAGSVTAQVAFEPLPDEGRLDDPWLDGLPVWPDGNWRDDPTHTADGAVTRQDLSPADPWVRRDDPWPTSTFQRRYLATGREDIARWRARLYRAQGRLGACWLPDGLAPVLRVQDEADADAGYLRVDAEAGAAFWHRPAAALILHPDGTRQAVLTGAFHQDAGGVLVLRSGLDAAVPAGSRVLRLARCRLDHDAVDLYWHTPEAVEMPLTLRLLPEPRGNDRITYTPS